MFAQLGLANNFGDVSASMTLKVISSAKANTAQETFFQISPAVIEDVPSLDWTPSSPSESASSIFSEQDLQGLGDVLKLNLSRPEENLRYYTWQELSAPHEELDSKFYSNTVEVGVHDVLVSEVW